MTAPMTHPLTPREKDLAIETDPKLSSTGVDDSALASGSGDHAELARLAEAAEHDPEYDGRSFEAAANPATVLALLAEIAALRAACSKSNDEISQTLGKALGYPWFKDDQINFPGATAENGVCVGDHVAESLADEAARRLTEAERKLAEAVGLLEEILPPVLCGESWGLPDDDVSHQRMSFGWIKKVRTFLSKEAERG